MAMECVFDEWTATLRIGSPDARRVGLVIGEKRLAVRIAVEVAFTETIFERQIGQRLSLRVVSFQTLEFLARRTRANDRLSFRFRSPAPAVAKPKLRQRVHLCVFRSAVQDFNANTNIF